MRVSGQAQVGAQGRSPDEGPDDLTPEERAALRLAREFSAQVRKERETVQRLGEYLRSQQQQTPDREPGAGAPTPVRPALVELPSLRVRSWRAGGVAHVQPLGELVAGNCAQLEQALRDVRPTEAELVLELGEVPLVDSAALSALLRARRHLAAEGVALRLDGVRPAVQRVLVITGLHKLFG